MAKFNFNLREAQSKIDNPTKTPINLIVRWDSKKLVYPTGETISPIYWQNNSKKSEYQRATQTKKFKSHAELNSRLKFIDTTADELFRTFVNDNKRQPTIEEFREILNEGLNNKKEKTLNFFEFFSKFNEDSKTRTHDKTGRIISSGTIKIYKNAYTHLKEFSKTRKRRIDFNTIDLDFYHDFSDYLTTEKKFAINTIGRIIKVVKTVLSYATERGLNTNLTFKSKRFRVISEKIENIYLTESELNELYNFDLSSNTRLEKVRDLFLIGCYTGLRFSDFSKLNPKNFNGDFIEIKTQKTDEKVIIPLHPKVLAIFQKYGNNLPSSISNQKMNSYIKEVGKLAAKELKTLNEIISVKQTRGGLETFTNFKKHELISSHTARRSMATNAYLGKVPPFVIMGVTGHKTEKAFFDYIKITSTDKAKIFQMYLNRENSLKAV